jgi:hypothetical protein
MSREGGIGGTIRQREVKEVVEDVMRAHNVPPSTWSIENGVLRLMIGARIAEVSCKRGQTFYSMQQLVAKVEQVISEFKSTKQRRQQVDLEDAIAASR